MTVRVGTVATTTTPLPGSTLRDRREALRVSRVALAVRVGFSPAHIAQLEAGYRPRRGDAVAAIDRALSELEAELNPRDEPRPAGGEPVVTGDSGRVA
jgi:transcriptional regulator with XRE-family HTH domain